MEITHEKADAAMWMALTGTLWFTDDGLVVGDPKDQCDYCGHSAPCPFMEEHLA